MCDCDYEGTTIVALLYSVFYMKEDEKVFSVLDLDLDGLFDSRALHIKLHCFYWR